MIFFRSMQYKLSMSLLVILLGVSACNFNTISLVKQKPANILVSITDPGTNGKYPFNGAVNVRAEAISDEPIQKMELWVDGVLKNTYVPSSNDLRFLAYTWAWESGSLGPHSLLIRAYTSPENMGQSNIINLTSIQDAGFILLITVEAGQTLEQIAQDHAVSIEQVLQTNPGLDPGQPLEPGQTLRIPVGVPAKPQGSRPSKPDLGVEPSLFGAWNFVSYRPNLSNSGNFSALPAAPQLTASVIGCNVTLNISDSSSGVTGYHLYRLNQAGQAFQLIASLPASSNGNLFYQDKSLAAGKYQYYASAYTSGMFAATVETPGNIIPVVVTDFSCSSGVFTIEGLLPNAKGFNKVYLYFSIDPDHWRRFPASDFTFVPSTQPVNLTEMVNLINPTSKGDVILQGEGWGWQGGVLTFLGTFKQTIPAPINFVGKSPSTLADFSKTTLQARGVPNPSTNEYNWETLMSSPKYDSHVFRWGTNVQATHGIWQVSSKPFPSDPSLNPACLLLTGEVPGGSLEIPTQFDIDFTPLAPSPAQATAGSGNQNINVGKVFIPNFPPLQPPYSVQSLLGNNQQTKQLETIYSKIDFCAPAKTSEGITTFYVRIMPEKDNQLLAPTSNMVVYKIDPTPQPSVTIQMAPTTTFYTVKILEFNEMVVPNIDFAYCVKVITNPFYPSALNKWGQAAPGSIVCADPFTGGNGGGILQDIGNFISDAINFIADAYNKLSDFVTKLVEKLNPLCIQAKFITDAVGSGQQQVDDACHMVAVATVTAAKTYVGLPPSLPNFDQLTSLGKDYLVEMAANEMENNGIPCPQDCKDLLSKGMDYSLDQLKSSMSSSACLSEQEAHQNGKEPLCPPAGVVTVPDPAGQPAPPTAVLEVTRTLNSNDPNITQPASCTVSLAGTASNNSYVGKTLNLYFGQATFKWQGAALNEPLIYGASPIPPLEPGKSVKIPLVLKSWPFWLPGHYSWYKQYINVPTYDDWAYLYQGATLQLSAAGSCYFPGFSSGNSPNVTGEEKTYGPLGNAYLQTCFPNCP